MRRARWLGTLGLAVAGLTACDRPATLPSAEFLVSAGDSTYWVASGPAGPQVRASSLLLTRWGGRLYEVYATDDDRSFPDAVFVAQQVWRRDLVSGDSLLVLADAHVPREAARWGAAHPDAPPLEPGEDGAAEPAVTVTADVALRELHGAFLTLDQFVDEEGAGRPARHAVRRTVVDLRSGARATLAALFGRPAAGAVEQAGRRALEGAVTAIRAAADSGALDPATPEVEVAGRRALATVRLDPADFGLAAVGDRPAVTFLARGTDGRGTDVTLPVGPIVVPGPTPAWWTADVRPTLPTWSADSAVARWASAPVGDRRRYEVRYVVRRGDGAGRPDGNRRPGPTAPDADEDPADSEREPATAATAALLVAAPGTADRSDPFDTTGGPGTADRPGVRAGTRPVTTVATLPTPLHAVLALDRPPLGRAERRALRRAFDASVLWGEGVTTVAWRRPRTVASRPAHAVVRRAAYAPPRAPAASR